MNDQDQSAISVAINEVANDKEVFDRIKADAATLGAKQALLKHAPEIVDELKKDWAAIQPAIPVIKAGYQTSEFWIVVCSILAVVVSNIIGHPLPWQETTVLGGVAAVYAFVRSVVKKGNP